MRRALVVLALVGPVACGGPAATPDEGPPALAEHPPAARPPQVSADAPSAAREHRGWYLTGRARLDLDGDGSLDAVRVREPDRGSGVEVIVQLAHRTEVLRMRHTSSLDFTPYEDAEVDGEPGEELFVMSEVPRRTFRTLTWQDGRFVEIPEPPGRELSDDFAPDGRAREWWVEDRGLVTYVSVRPCATGYDWVRCPAVMPVEASRWRVVHGRWSALSTGVRCVSRDRPRELTRC